MIFGRQNLLLLKYLQKSSFIPCLHCFFSDIPEPAPIGLSFLSLHQNPFVKPAMTPASDTSQPSFSLTDQQRVIQRTTPPSLTRHFHAHQMHLSPAGFRSQECNAPKLSIWATFLLYSQLPLISSKLTV